MTLLGSAFTVGGRVHRAVTAVVVMGLMAAVVNSAGAPPAAARAAAVWKPPQTPLASWPYVTGHDRARGVATPPRAATDAPRSPVAWPQAGTSRIAVSGGAAGATPGGGALRFAPARTAGAVRAGAPTAVAVTVAGRAAASAAGIDGVVFSVHRADSATGTGRSALTVDYRGFAAAYGGDFGARLSLVALPACALTTPRVPACRVRTPVPGAVNNPLAGTLTADIDVAPAAAPARPMTARTGAALAPGSAAQSDAALVFAATSSPSDSSGTYTATTLKGSSTWSEGGSEGSFDYSVPISVPPALGGSTPSVALSYDSQSVDAETVVENQQPGWVGDGWDYQPGFIERSYQPCAKEGKKAGADYQYSGDNCWLTSQTVTMSGPQHGGPLVYDATNGWKLSSDDGSKVELLSGAANGAYKGEYWRVTDTSGVQYYYGVGHLPGGNGSDPLTNAAWTEPVYGPNSGDPCHGSTFVASSCDTMAYRWNLDFVIDTHGNVVRYDYATESNFYASGIYFVPTTGGTSLTQKSYVRAGHPTTISYGYRVANAAAGAAPAAQISFGVCQRTETGGCDQTQITSANAAGWVDTPYDQYCGSALPCTNYSPTFWSTVRLGTISTSVLVGTAPRTVDTWTLNQVYPEPGDGERVSMWLSSVQRTASNGQSAIPMPPVTFGVAQLANRVSANFHGTQVPLLLHYRIGTVTSETGAITSVTYSDSLPGVTACSATNLPAAQDHNTWLCFPEYWDPGDGNGAQIDWFNKYVVTQVQTVDSTGISPTRTVTYDYGTGGGAWHSNDSEITDPAQRVWDQWRGFAAVTTRTGTAGQSSGGTADPISATTSSYLRGMDGDIDANGVVQHPSAPTDTHGGTHGDDNALAGSPYETRTFNGWTSVGGLGPIASDVISYPSVLAVTATHARISPLPALTAAQTGTTKTLAFSPLASGGTRSREVDYTFDTPATGSRPLTTDDKGDGTAAGEVCTQTWYAASASVPQRLNFADRTLELNAPCGSTPTAANTISDQRTLYDFTTDAQFGTLPTGGPANPTATEVLDSYNGTTPTYVTTATTTYDPYGRITSSTDPNAYDALTHSTGAKTTTAYSPSSGAIPTQITVTNPEGYQSGASPANWQTVTTYDPGRSQATHIVDMNGRVTDETYDASGRLTAVWKPGRTMGSDSANLLFSYVLPTGGSPGTPGYVQTQTLRENLSYTQSFQILDSLLNTVQTQASAPDGSTGRVVADTYYDSHGWTWKTSAAYAEQQPPSGTFDTSYNTDNAIPSQTVTRYDGAGRTTLSSYYSYGQLQWSTTTAYPGSDETDVTPPAGGTPTTTITDIRGNAIARWSYHTPTATGRSADADVTTYTYTPDGKRKSVTDPAAAHSWSWTYDLRGRVTSASDPDTGVTDTYYTKDGQVDHTVDARGDSLGYTYDLLGRKIGEYQAPPGQALNTGDPTTQALGWSYDAAAKGYPDSASRYIPAPGGTGANGPAFTFATSGYTTAYQPTGTTVTIPAAGLPANESALAGTYQTKMWYTPNTNLLATYEYPAAGGLALQDVTNTYNTAGELTNAGMMTLQTYTPLGQPWVTTLGAVPYQTVLTNTTDPATGRLVSAVLDKESAATHVEDTTFTYNPAGLTTSVSDVYDGASTDTQCFGYDWAGRLSQAWTSKNGVTAAASPSVPALGGCATTTPSASDLGGPAPYWQSYPGYDTTGNRLSMVNHDVTGNTANDITTGYVYNAPTAAHALSSTTTATGGGAASPANQYAYDLSGNTVSRAIASGPNQTLTWDAEGHLAAITDTGSKAPISSYLYAPDGSTLIRRDASTNQTTLYLPGQEVHLNTANGALTGLRYYATPGGLSIARTSGGSVTYEYNDPHGTSTTAIDSATLAETHRYFDPFGNPRGAGTAWVDDHAFLNKPNDTSTQLTEVGARQYDPALGRFASVDPVLEATDAQQIGGYAYAGDDPVSNSDPAGTMLIGDGGGGSSSSSSGSSGSSDSGAHFCDGCDYGGNQTACTSPGCPGIYGPVAPITTPWGTTVNGRSPSVAGMVCTQVGPPKYQDTGNHGFMGFLETATKWGGLVVGGIGAVAGFAGCEIGTAGIASPACAAGLIGAGEFLGCATGTLCAFGGETATPSADPVDDPAASGGGGDGADPAVPAEPAAGGGKCSFDPATPVLMADGGTKPIGRIRVGDRVEAADPATGKEAGGRTVRHVWINHDTDLLDVTVKDGTGRPAVLHTTANHPFFDRTAGAFVRADHLAVGDRLGGVGASVPVVLGVRATPGAADRDNLTVEQLHTYYVVAGDTPVLVHNTTCVVDANGYSWAPDHADTSVLGPGQGWDPSQGTPVLGRQVDTEIGGAFAGHTHLALPDWTLAKNDAWIQTIIDQRGTAYAGTSTSRSYWNPSRGEPTVYAREVQQLLQAGYQWQGDYLEPPPAP